MATKQLSITHTFAGGWATDLGQTIYAPPDGNGQIRVPFLTDAQNVVYEYDGGPRKCPGSSAFNTTVGASLEVYGLFDYWRQGTAGSPTQRKIIHAGTVCMHDQGTGTFTNLFTGLADAAVPNYNIFNDLLIIASDNDTPRSWDLTTAQSLAGSPPSFSFSTTHRGRCWAAGVNSMPSRLYYSVAGNPEDWTGVGSGSLDIDPGDGDRITGLLSHQDVLFVFKGPYKLSIHVIQGATPNDFSKALFVRGISAAWQNAIFKFGDDAGFISPRGSVHSLSTTQKYGNFVSAYLSYPIGQVCRDRLAHNRHRYWQAIDDSTNGRVLLAVTGTGGSTNNRVFCMDYRFMANGESYPRWSYWDAFTAESLAMVIDSNNRIRPFMGSNDGIVYKLEQDVRSHKSAAINYTVETPFFTYGSEVVQKSLYHASVGLVPRNNNTVTFGWTRDFAAAQTYTTTQGNNGGVFDTGTFDSAVFGGSSFSPRFMLLHEGGQFRSVQYRVQDTANSSDIELHSIGAGISIDGWSTVNS